MANKSVTTAAGTVTLDISQPDRARVLLVHRPAYDDWTLPKGKLHTDEYLPACAHRETEEETGVRVRLEAPLDMIRYTVGGGKKVVHYWRATALNSKRRRPDREVDKVVWLSVRNALTRMTYGDERMLVEQATRLAGTTPFLIVRHGKAMERKHWSGRDQARPVNARGRRQSSALVPLLDSYGVESLASSSSTRCVQTLKPYAKQRQLDVESWSALSEEQAEKNAKGAAQVMRRLIERAAGTGTPTAVCGHRPVLPLMLECLGVPDRPMQTAAVVVAHLDAEASVVAVEWHKPRL